jgi:aqualysin 1
MRSKHDSATFLRSGVPLVVAVVLLWTTATATSAQTAKLIRSPNAIGGRYIVKLAAEAKGRSAADLSVLADSLTSAHGGQVRRVYSHVFTGFAASMTAAQAEALSQDAAVEYVEEDAVVSLSDIQIPATWGIDRIDQRDLPLSDSYTYGFTGHGVKAYIVDTGIRQTHVEFGGRVISGFNAIDDDNGTNDCNGHGTHVAGTVGGATYGVAKGVTLVPVRVLNCYGFGSLESLIAGVDWVTGDHEPGQPAAANMSLGGPASASLDAAVEDSIAGGVTYVVSSGNSNADACGQSPARLPSAITVNASTRTDVRAFFSNWGSCTDIFAPGDDIKSAAHWDDTATERMSGTSMASPHVTGVASLYLESNPGARPSAVWREIRDRATIGRITNPRPGSPNRLLYSRIGRPDCSPRPCAPGGLIAIATADTQVRLSWTDESDNEVGFVVERSGHGSGGPYSTVATVAANETSITDTVASCTNYHYRVSAFNGAGSSEPFTRAFIARPCEPPIALEPGTAWPNPGCSTPAPTLKWTSVPRADFYTVRVLTDEDQFIVDAAVPDLAYHVPAGALRPDIRYHWKVKAENENGFSPYSNILAFKVCTSLSIGDVTVVEGTGGLVAAVFEVSLASPLSIAVSVDYTTAPGTARAADFTAVSGTLTFDPGDTRRTIAVPVIGDALDEALETFYVDLSGATNAGIADGRGDGTITDDDAPPIVSIGDATLMEGDTGTRDAVLQVSLSAASGQLVRVPYATADGTATAPSDYTATSGAVTFAEGEVSTTLHVPIVGDAVWEPEESLFVHLGTPLNATPGDGQGQIAIVNDDLPILSIGDTALKEGPPGGPGSLTVTLNAPRIVDVTVQYQTRDCTANKGSDYPPLSGALTFLPGQTSKTIEVSSIGDATFEGSETFIVELSSPTQAVIADGHGQITLVDDDPNPDPPLGLPPADFNGDGHVDIIWRQQASGQLAAWLMTSINQGAGSIFDTLGDLSWKVVGTADFNGDGKTDILWRHDVSGGLAAWFMDGLVRTDGVAFAGMPDPNWKVAGTGDFNGDRRPDILWRNEATGGLTAWLMSGTTVLSNTPLNPSVLADLAWQIAGLGDFNHDGKTDILWRHQGSTQLVAWLMDGVNQVGGGLLTPATLPDTNWRPSATGDFNGDEHTDVLWRHQASGELVVWLMSGMTQTCGVYLNPDRLTDPGWSVVGPR